MKIPSVVLHIEIAKVGDGFVVQHDAISQDNTMGYVGVAAASMQQGTCYLYLKSREELTAWLANIECKI